MIPIGETQDGRADMTNFEMDLFDTRINSYALEKEESEQCCRHSIIKPACVPVSIISLFILMVVFFPLFNEDGIDSASLRYERSGFCADECRVELVETIPTGMTFENSTMHRSTFELWQIMLTEAKSKIDIASYYWNLRDEAESASHGNRIFDGFVNAASKGLSIRIIQNPASASFPQNDSQYLDTHGYATVRSLDMARLLRSTGVLHTKFWIIDTQHVYVGSANMDWKSLSEVKELGFVVWNCPCLANDLAKIFSVYWRLGLEGSKIPAKWPLNLRTFFNFSHPLKLTSNEANMQAFISNSPRPLSAKGREDDGDAIVSIMDDAQQFIHISVMDYVPATIYVPKANATYWSKLDDAIRASAYRGITVRLLVSHWSHSKPQMLIFLKSLLEINDAVPKRGNKTGIIEIKLFTVPSNPGHKDYPFTRVNHNKYMVTDRIAYVGTSNWVGDYFINTAGVGLSFISSNLSQSLNDVFMRDWSSIYARNLTEVLLEKQN